LYLPRADVNTEHLREPSLNGLCGLAGVVDAKSARHYISPLVDQEQVKLAPPNDNAALNSRFTQHHSKNSWQI
jgi:hypothetical protein